MQKLERQIRDNIEIKDILKNGKFAIISMCRDNEPYIVTLSYGFDNLNNSLYFHTAKQGLKLDFIKQNPYVCGTVIEDKGYKINQCSHAYRTIVFWGDMHLIEDLEEKKHGFEILMNQLEKEPEKIKERFLKTDESYEHASILRLNLKEITGKESQ